MMSLRRLWERRRLLLTFLITSGTCAGAASAESGLNLAVPTDLINGMVTVMAGLVDLVVAAIPAIVVFSVVLLLYAILSKVEKM